MNITTDNIGEWCFRYLEKDLNTMECAFFENELKINPILPGELNAWRKSYITKSNIDIDAGNFSGSTSLFRYKNQFLFLLTEFLLISATATYLLLSSPKSASGNVNHKTIHSTVKEDRTVVSKDVTISQKNIYSLQKGNVLVVDSVFVNKRVQPEIIKQHIDHIRQTIPDTTYTYIPAQDSISETSVVTKKPGDIYKSSSDSTKAKKKLKRFNKTGSRLIPINNDL
jgi:hypothetical protein